MCGRVVAITPGGDDAEERHHAALAINEELGDRAGIAIEHHHLGDPESVEFPINGLPDRNNA